MNKALIIINVSKDESMPLAKEIAAYLKKKDVAYDFLSFDGFVDNTDFKGYDFVISLGGDGTVLYAARNASKYGLPVFPVNLGEFGFIASVQPEDWQKELKIFMDGKAVFKAAVTAFDQAIKDALEEANLTLEDIDHVVCHQANVRIINHVANKHKESKDKFYVNIDRYANTSAASIPIALDELYENNKIKKGQKVLLVAFGAGFTWSSAIYTA